MLLLLFVTLLLLLITASWNRCLLLRLLLLLCYSHRFKALGQSLLRILLHKVLLHPVLSDLIPLLDFLSHCVVKIQVRFKVGFRVAIRLLIISILELVNCVQCIYSLRILDSILATSLSVQKLMMVPCAEIVPSRVRVMVDIVTAPGCPIAVQTPT